jgi:hypothetical protein
MSVLPVVNLTIDKGTDFEASFVVTGDDTIVLNLLDTVAAARIKKYPTSPIGFDFVVGISTVDGEINISMGRSVTSQLPSGRNYFDVFIRNTDLNFTSKVVTGSIIVEDTTDPIFLDFGPDPEPEPD